MKVRIYYFPVAFLILIFTTRTATAGHETFLPSGDIFTPLLADPKQPRFSVSFRQYENREDFFGTAVGFGENFGMYRYERHETGGQRALQLNIQAGLFALFEMNDPAYTLINTDYIIGFPVTFRSGAFSWKFNPYHQSSHLGDEYIIREGLQSRKSFLYDAVEFLASYEWRSLRGYMGGEYLAHRVPSSFDPGVAHAGMEYYGNSMMGSGRVVAGLDLKSYEEHGWYIDTSLRAGLEFGRPAPSRRKLRVLIEGFRGFAHWGQFYKEKVAYYGIGIHMSQ